MKGVCGRLNKLSLRVYKSAPEGSLRQTRAIAEVFARAIEA